MDDDEFVGGDGEANAVAVACRGAAGVRGCYGLVRSNSDGVAAHAR
jgi:hypothetical protein